MVRASTILMSGDRIASDTVLYRALPEVTRVPILHREYDE